MARGMGPACRDNRPRSTQKTIEKQPQTAPLRRLLNLRFDPFPKKRRVTIMFTLVFGGMEKQLSARRDEPARLRPAERLNQGGRRGHGGEYASLVKLAREFLEAKAERSGGAIERSFEGAPRRDRSLWLGTAESACGGSAESMSARRGLAYFTGEGPGFAFPASDGGSE
jgi:hypothetical protein